MARRPRIERVNDGSVSACWGPPYQPCPNLHPHPPHPNTAFHVLTESSTAAPAPPPQLHYWLGRGQTDKELCGGAALCSPRSGCRVTAAVCHRLITEQIHSLWFSHIQTPIMGLNASVLRHKSTFWHRLTRKVWLQSLSDGWSPSLFTCSRQNQASDRRGRVEVQGLILLQLLIWSINL